MGHREVKNLPTVAQLWRSSIRIKTQKHALSDIQAEKAQPFVKINSVQFSCSVVSDSLRPHESQHARLPYLSPTPRVHPNSRASSRWCHPAISSCRPLFLLPPIPPSIRVFSNESTLFMRWPKYWKALILQISPGLARLGERMYSFLSSSHSQVNRIRMFAWTKTLQFSIQAERKVSPGRPLCVDSILLLNKSNVKQRLK